MRIIDWILGRKKIQRRIGAFAVVVNTDVAKENGIDDEFNREIRIYKNAKLTEKLAYSKENVLALRNVDEIPVEFESSIPEEEFEFDDVARFGSVTLRR